jgi:hypothetical protein
MDTTFIILYGFCAIISIAIVYYLMKWVYLIHIHSIAQTNLLATIAEANKVKEEIIQEILNEIKPNYDWYSDIE